MCNLMEFQAFMNPLKKGISSRALSQAMKGCVKMPLTPPPSLFRGRSLKALPKAAKLDTKKKSCHIPEMYPLYVNAIYGLNDLTKRKNRRKRAVAGW